MLIVPGDEIEPTGLTVEAAFQMIVSAGVAVPQTLRLPGNVARPVQVAAEEATVRWSGAPT